MHHNHDIAFPGGDGVAHKTKKDILADKIIEMITTGLLRDQDELPGERELAKLFEVSRETVRGALSKIAAYGLISVSQGSKSRVNASEERLKKFQHLHHSDFISVNHYNVDEVFTTRLAIEIAAVRQAAALITAPQTVHLNALVQAQRDMLQDPVRFQLSDQYFHKLLAQACGNELLLKYSTELYNYGLMIRREVMSEPGAIQRSVAEHGEIVSALKSGDVERSASAMRQHLQSVYETTKRMLEKS